MILSLRRLLPGSTRLSDSKWVPSRLGVFQNLVNPGRRHSTRLYSVDSSSKSTTGAPAAELERAKEDERTSDASSLRTLSPQAITDVSSSPTLPSKSLFGSLTQFKDKEYSPAERYAPPRDPFTLLIEPHRLTSYERIYQMLFLVMPWSAFLIMACFPVFLFYYHIPSLKTQADKRREEAERVCSIMNKHPFDNEKSIVGGKCSFIDVFDAMDAPVYTLLYTYHPSSLISPMTTPIIRDLAKLFKEHSIPIGVMMLDISDPMASDTYVKDNELGCMKEPLYDPPSGRNSGHPGIITKVAGEGLPPGSDSDKSHKVYSDNERLSKNLCTKFPPSLSPYIHFIIPFGIPSGEPALLEYSTRDSIAAHGDPSDNAGAQPTGDAIPPSAPENRGVGINWSLSDLLTFINTNVTPIPQAIMSEADALDDARNRLLDRIFEKSFISPHSQKP